jgi:hypothetical protein
MLVITKMQYGKSREQIEKEATALTVGFVLVGVIFFVTGLLLEQYKVPVTFLGTTIGYDYPYTGILGRALLVGVAVILIGGVAGYTYYYSSIRTPYLGAPLQHKTTFCRYCGGEIIPDSVFCPNCGRNLT